MRIDPVILGIIHHRAVLVFHEIVTGVAPAHSALVIEPWILHTDHFTAAGVAYPVLGFPLVVSHLLLNNPCFRLATLTSEPT